MAKKAVKKTIAKPAKAENDGLKKVDERLKYYRKKAGYTSSEYFAYEHSFSRPQYGKYKAGASLIR